MDTMEQMMTILGSSIFEVFEKMFFIFLDPADQEESGYEWESTISFEGAESGEIKLSLSDAILRTMVQNMLNIPEDGISSSDMEDCAREAVNMICGNFLAKYDKTKRFDLSIPVCAPITEGSSDLRSYAQRLCYTCDETNTGVSIALVSRSGK